MPHIVVQPSLRAAELRAAKHMPPVLTGCRVERAIQYTVGLDVHGTS